MFDACWPPARTRVMTCSHPLPFDHAIVSACRLAAARPDVTSVTVVIGRRPTFAEALRWRQCALECDVSLSIDGSGIVTVRRAARQRQREARVGRTAGRRRRAALGTSLVEQVRRWRDQRAEVA